MRVMGIDQGLASIGVGVVEFKDDTEQALYNGKLSTKNDKKRDDEGLPKRMDDIYEYLKKTAIEYEVDMIATEDLFNEGGFKASGVKSGIMVTGIIFLLANELNLPIVKYSPKTVKMVITGRGTAKKPEIIKAINHRNIQERKYDETSEKESHEADAIAIAITAKAYNFKNMPKKEKATSKPKTTKTKTTRKKAV